MKNVGVRVVSAALAACMMTSVLPVSAFAAVGMEQDAETGIAVMDAEDETVQELASGTVKITASGSYRVNKEQKTVVVEAEDQNVKIYIDEDIDTENSQRFRIISVRNLTIINRDHTVDAGTATVLSVDKDTSITGTLQIEGGAYSGKNGFFIHTSAAGAAELKNVDVTAGNVAVSNQGAGTLL